MSSPTVASQNGVAQADELFFSVAWFENLLANGFVVPATPHEVRQDTPAGTVVLHLMDAKSGYGLTGLANYYSGLFGFQGYSRESIRWDALVKSIRRLPGSSLLNLHPLDAEAPWVAPLEQGLRQAGYWTDRYFCFGNWYQPVPPGGFVVYWAERPSALRNTVARARKRLDRQGRWQLEIVTGESPVLDAAIDAYVSVYNRSWKVPEPNPAFMPGLIRLAAQQGWLRLGLVYVGDEPVAAQLWLVAGGKANIFKLAYVKGQEKLSVGSVLTAELMRHVMDIDRVREVDFLSGDDPYKANWMDQRRERIGLVAFDKRHWRGWLAATRHRLGQWRRSWRRMA